MKKTAFLLLIAFSLWIVSCERNPSGKQPEPAQYEKAVASPKKWDGNKRADITYQLLVYSFADKDGDGWGDLAGLTDKLDYIDALGVRAVWLSPIHPAMSYHGYDVTDYAAVNPRYGTMDGFKQFVAAAHQRNIKVYLDFVINHTGRNHPWFTQALCGTDNPYRNYYIFSKNPRADIVAGNIPMIATEGANGYDSGQWFGAASPQGAVNYHSHFWTSWFADLNYGAVETAENSPAFKAMVNNAKIWIDAGVDGFRLDAVKHIYHNEFSDENPRFLKKFYDAVNTYYKAKNGTDIYMVGEVFSASDKVAPYYTGLPSLFEFSFWWFLQNALQQGTGNTFVQQVLAGRTLYDTYRKDPVVATKLSNHDEVRTRSYLGNSAGKTRVAGAVLLTAGGSPYVYYGEELGYTGQKERGDEYLRAPMLWGDGYTTSYTDKVDPALSQIVAAVITQEADSAGLLNMYRRFAEVRNTYASLATGTMTPHATYNASNSAARETAVWYRTAGNERMLVMHNLSGLTVTRTLDAAVDNVARTVACQGQVMIKREEEQTQVRMEGYSSIILELK